MTTLSTHILDTMHGGPAAGVAVRQSGPDGALFAGVSDGDGRCSGRSISPPDAIG